MQGYLFSEARPANEIRQFFTQGVVKKLAQPELNGSRNGLPSPAALFFGHDKAAPDRPSPLLYRRREGRHPIKRVRPTIDVDVFAAGKADKKANRPVRPSSRSSGTR